MIALFLMLLPTGLAAEDSTITFNPTVCGGAGRPTGPVTVGLLPGRLGIIRDSCIRTEAGLAFGGSLLVDTADFYGRIQMAASLDLRLAVSERVEVFGRLEGFRSDNVIAPISVSRSGNGATTVGMSVVVEQSDEDILTVHSQLVLPTAPYVNAAPIGLDVGVSSIHLIAGGDLHGGANLYGQALLGRGPGAERLGLTAQVGLTQRLSKQGIAVVFDVPLSLGWTGGLDHLGLATALRFGGGSSLTPDGERPRGRGLYGELGLFAPLLGKERTLVATELRLGSRFN